MDLNMEKYLYWQLAKNNTIESISVDNLAENLREVDLSNAINLHSISFDTGKSR